jgi:hypothetical protein
MSTPPVRLVGMVLALSAGCACAVADPAGLPEYPYAYAARSCAPWDGFAVSLVLRRDSLAPGDSLIEQSGGPMLQLGLYPRDRGRGSGPTGLAPYTFRWPLEPEEASGARCQQGPPCETFSRGRIAIRSISPDGAITGEVELESAQGAVVRGGFRAAWRQRVVYCG